MNQLTTYKTEDAYVNITPIAKHYGKKTADYLIAMVFKFNKGERL